jgi:hypothetical protein
LQHVDRPPEGGQKVKHHLQGEEIWDKKDESTRESSKRT